MQTASRSTGGGAPEAERAAGARLVPRRPVEGSRDGLAARVEYGLFRAFAAAAGTLPTPAVAPLATGFARLARRVDRRHSDAARRTLDVALGPDLDPGRREELVLHAWRHVVRVSAATARLGRGGASTGLDQFALDVAPGVARVAAERRGALVLSAHLGNLIAGGLALRALGFTPLHFVTRPVKNRPISRHLQRVFEELELNPIARRGALAEALRVLRAGGTLVALTDQRARIAPVTAPFFGRPVPTEQGPIALARRADVPIVVGACLFDEGPRPYRLVARAVLRPEEARSWSTAEIATWVNGELERLIRAAPEQYFWLHDRFRGAGPPVAGTGAAGGAAEGRGAESERT